MNDGYSKANPYSGDMDPDIAKLMGIEEPEQKPGSPNFAELFDEERRDIESSKEEVDLTKESFAEITKYEEAPKPFFSDKDYYKKVLSNEGEVAQRLHSTLTEFLNTQDPKDRSLFRGKLMSAYWNFASSMVSKIYTELPMPKVLLLRYGMLLPSLLSTEHLQILSKIIFDNNTGEPVYYVDEWMRKIATGQVAASATDETKVQARSSGSRMTSLIEKAAGQRDLQFSSLRTKINELDISEDTLQNLVSIVLNHDTHSTYRLKDSFNTEQRKALFEIQEILKRLNTLDKEISRLYMELDDADKQLGDLKAKAAELGDEVGVDNQAITGEFNTVRQMIKLSVGRQGNHFPFLMKQYLRPTLSEYATRENVITAMAFVESLDKGLFLRTFKRQTSRIVPHTIIVPCYGERGVCWEPFEKFNRATSRGRIAIPLYPKDVKTAVIAALADLRWQVAKEKAQHYWMEEGLTGKYYQWYTERKLKGDVKEYFIQDYLLWITKESEGTQKLDRDVRGIFWRHIPFPQDLKDSLKNRGFVYSELYKKDINRSMSDGY